ncbi:MAG: late competence development ComFB family protein [Gammaproteobacteria bacterium]|nr:late competence development ComFB family protein [Gammaproteobacteria bacterium]
MDSTSIHNYYEHLVIDYMQTEVIPAMPDKSNDFFLDVACYALTKLPARYMRHEIDMAFYLDSNERTKMHNEVEKAVKKALKYIGDNFNKDSRYD